MTKIKFVMVLMAIYLAGCSTIIPQVTPNSTGNIELTPQANLTSIENMGNTPTAQNTQIPPIPPSEENNLYGIPYQSPEWLIIPMDNDHPFNILVLGIDEKCTLTINSKTDFTGLKKITDVLILGTQPWNKFQTFEGNIQIDEIYFPDAYPPEYTEGGGIVGNGYAISGFYDSCRLSIQSILAKML